MKQIIEKLRKEFEATGYASWINSDIYPDGRIYTKEYTEWLEKQIVEALEGNKCEMTSERIREIQESTAYAQSISVKKALLQVWHECVTGISKKSVQEKMLKDLSAKELEDDVNRNKI